jgi:hypothetical protein
MNEINSISEREEMRKLVTELTTVWRDTPAPPPPTMRSLYEFMLKVYKNERVAAVALEEYLSGTIPREIMDASRATVASPKN